MAKKPPFTAEQFVAAHSDTAADKAKGANALAAWVEKDFPWEGFTNKLYTILHIHLFGHIAHGNKQDFYKIWFAGTKERLNWLEYVLQGGACPTLLLGSPTATWSDVERAFKRWLFVSGIREAYAAKFAGEEELRERTELVRLLAKYGTPAEQGVIG